MIFSIIYIIGVSVRIALHFFVPIHLCREIIVFNQTYHIRECTFCKKAVFCEEKGWRSHYQATLICTAVNEDGFQ